MKKYVFRKYDKNYPKFFEKEKARLERIINFPISLEHIGSTSIPGLGGKGIVDVLIVVSKKYLNSIKLLLVKSGYTLIADVLHSSRTSFYKDYWKFFGKRRVHVHLTYPNSRTYHGTLKFKKFLLQNNKIAEKYAEIKKEGAKLAGGNGDIYRAHKKKFVEKYSK